MQQHDIPNPTIVPFVMPLGIIDQVNDHGAIFITTRPTDAEAIPAGASVTIWDMDANTGALARYRGRISEMSDTIGSFVIEDTDISPNWPSHLNPVQPGNPVYLALPDSYEPDQTRLASAWELDQLQRMAEDFQQRTGITTMGRVSVVRPALLDREEPDHLE